MGKKRTDNREPHQASTDSQKLANRSISRRDFVRASGTIILASGVAVCTDGTTPSILGSIHLVLVGLHPTAATGGTAMATPMGGGNQITIDIPAVGDQTVQVPVGNYAVTYTPPANHQLAPGQTIPPSITITEGQTTSVNITLVATGSIQVTITGLSGGPPNGGTASAQRTDAAGSPVVINVSAAGSGTATVPAGTYTVTYTPPNGFTATTTNPLTGLVVGVGATPQGAFSVSATPTAGTIHVTVSGLTGAASGGSVSARLTNNTGSTFSANLPVPQSGSTSVDLPSIPAGSYNVTYTAPSGYRLVAGQSNPIVVSVVASATANAAFNAEVNTAPVGLVFASAWSTATGNTDNAARDGGKWTTAYNVANPSPDRVSVISAAGLGFPVDMPNVLAIRYEEATSTFCGINKQNGWQLPAIGGVLCRRMYFRHNIDGTSSASHHPVQSAFQAGSCPYAAEWNMTKGDTFAFQIATLMDGNCTASCHRWQTTLTRGTTYRIEERYERVSTLTWKLHVRIYDSSNALIRQDADFGCSYHSPGSHSLASNLDIVTPDPTCMQHMFIVNQGVGPGRGSDNAAANRIYYGGFAVSLTDWCGPFVAGEGT